MSPPDEPSEDAGESGPGTEQSFGPNQSGPREWWRWFRTTDNGTVVFVREMLESAAVVVAVGLLLFAISGVWPPMVAVESPSMEPHMERGDLVFIMDEQRLAPDAAHAGTGVVTYQTGQQSEYESFGSYGDVIIFKPDGSDSRTPIIHRARFWVDENENWYQKADQEYVRSADNCQELPNCPAPHAGFITKGDNNGLYDQAGAGISSPVQPDWIRGTAEVKVPWLGHVRLFFSEASAPTGFEDRSLSTDDRQPETLAQPGDDRAGANLTQHESRGALAAAA